MHVCMCVLMDSFVCYNFLVPLYTTYSNANIHTHICTTYLYMQCLFTFSVM